jgi:hypothetical protein
MNPNSYIAIRAAWVALLFWAIWWLDCSELSFSI